MRASIDRARLAAMTGRELAVFQQRAPRSAELAARAAAHLPGGVPMSWMSGLYRTPLLFAQRGEGAMFWDVDGHSYLDFNLCDLSMSLGFAPRGICEAVDECMRRGAHFLLPVEDAVSVAEHLATLIGLPFWQFTLSASGANTEVLRIARHRTGLVVFSGHYHGHIDETLVEPGERGSRPALAGLPAAAARDTTILPFNDLQALERRLARGDVALVLTEPALSNCNVVLPQPEFLDGVHTLCRRSGTLLCLDEAHTFQFAYGGLARAWRLSADFVVLGKGLGSGVPFGLYGMNAELGDFLTRNLDIDIGPKGIATGGTTYATAVAAAAARVALERYWTFENCARLQALGDQLAAGLQAAFGARALPWRAFHLGPRSGYCLMPELPLDGASAAASLDAELIDLRRLFMANRGIWDAVVSAGPQVSHAHSRADIERYLTVAGEFLDELSG